ncbi:hypothetical protein KDW_18720 [Dictyobacter vulcani]|uniref:Protein kinase domain-containing protein n=1 Tax=Dictyobacter vulcani TaxID=2607529 RepID=A0A5J4KMT1_9CHLR|nr:hypothetical protein [Dictyobacter vulcani]GER87710.1 hypothetical protein KDW_18720 [Dictyobacter vulcani]
MPDRLAYDEAMLFAATRLKIADPDLKQGKVATVTTTTALGSVERPWGIEGGFAVVYKFITRSGKARALRCFRVPINQDMRYRYERIGPFFAANVPDITVEAQYYADSIVVKEQGIQPPRAYPVIDMQWVDGLTLLEAVDAYCQRHDTVALQRLSERWLQLLIRMWECGMAHGDLAGVNVMLGSAGQLLLVDYDGVYIPEFGPTGANLGRVLLGQPDYQHPMMKERGFNARMDDFSALVIYTALLALTLQPTLWETYGKRDASGRLLDTNLLFTRLDFKDPAQSGLFSTLARLDDPHLSAALSALRHACQQPIDQVHFPMQFMEHAAGQVAVSGRPLPVSLPVGSAAAPGYRSVAASSVLRTSSIASRPVSWSVTGRSIRASERGQTAQAIAFEQVCQTEDDEAIAAAYEELSNFGHVDAQVLPEALVQRGRLAQQRRSALARFRMALASKRPLQIAGAYDAPLLNECQNVTEQEHALLALARAFAQAYNQSSADYELIAAYENIAHSPYARAFTFSEQEQTRLHHLQQQTIFRTILAEGNPWNLLVVYDPVLEEAGLLSMEEQQALNLARTLTQALEQDEDDVLAEAYQHWQQHSDLFMLPAAERRRLELAHKRLTARQRFQQALTTRPPDAQQLLAAYDPRLLGPDLQLTTEQRTLLREAQAYLRMQQTVFEGIDRDQDVRIRHAYQRTLEQRFRGFSAEDHRRIEGAFAARDIEQALADKDYGQALLKARTLLEITGPYISKLNQFKLQKAAMRFIREQDLLNLELEIRQQHGLLRLYVSWDWPAHSLVEQAVIVWSPEHWPARLPNHRPREALKSACWIKRAAGQSRGQCDITLDQLSDLSGRIYIQGYSALQDPWDQQGRWFFADGNEPTSQRAVVLSAFS